MCFFVKKESDLYFVINMRSIKDENICIEEVEMEPSTIMVEHDSLDPNQNKHEMVYEVVQVDPNNGNIPNIVSTTTNAFNPTTIQTAVLARPISGNLYVIGTTSNNEVYTSRTNHKPIAPRTSDVNVKTDPTPCYRDDKRRATHNEIERKRRDKINSWIIKLGNIVPYRKESKHDYDTYQSKGGILEKVYYYISELKEENEKLADLLRENEEFSSELSDKIDQIKQLSRENKELKMLLLQHGINRPKSEAADN